MTKADEVQTTNGRVIRGIVQEQTGQSVVVLVAGGSRMTIRRDSVAEIRLAEPGDNASLLGDMALQEGNLWEAVGHYAEAVELGVDPEQVAAELVKSPTALVTMTENEAPERAGEIRNFVLRLLRDVPRDDDALHLAARLCEVTNDRDRARGAYEQISEMWWRSHPQESQAAAQFHLADARAALAEDDFGAVMDAFEQMTVVDQDLAVQLRPVFIIRWANGLIDQGQWARAIEMVGESVTPAAPEMARLWMESVFSEIEHRPMTGQALDEVAPVFARLYPRYFPENAEEHLAQLYLRLGDEHLAQGEYEAARAAYNEHYDIVDPQATVRPKVLEARFMEEAVTLAPDDWEGHSRLAMELIDQELWEAALVQLDALADAPDTELKVFAAQQRHAIQGRMAEESFRRAMDLYSQEKYENALDVLTADAALYEPARLSGDVEQLRRLCQDRMNEEPNRRAIAALAQYQRAERHFFTGQYTQAIAILNSLLTDYPEAPAAEEARVMLREARRFAAVRQAGDGPIDLAAAEDASLEFTAAAASSSEILAEARRREFQQFLDSASGVAAAAGETPNASR